MDLPQHKAAGQESRLASEIAGELLNEFPALAAGPILAVVVRSMADLRRIAISADTAASVDDYRRVIFEQAYHHLARL
jgi:hypothetical protein